jgi:hypothetical protein
MSANEANPAEVLLSRRRLLMNSAKVTAGAVAFYGVGIEAAPLPANPELVAEVSEDVSDTWTTF